MSNRRTEPGEKRTVVNFSMPESFRPVIYAAAEKANMAMSRFVEAAIREKIAREEAKHE